MGYPLKARESAGPCRPADNGAGKSIPINTTAGCHAPNGGPDPDGRRPGKGDRPENPLRRKNERARKGP